MNVIKKISESYSEFLSEDKVSLIKNKLVLPDISNDNEKTKFKATLIDFFKKHPNYENKINWNKAKTLTKADFESVLSLEDSSKTAQRKREKEEISKDIKNIFKSEGNRKFKIVGENKKWLFVAPLTWEAAIYCNSSKNQGESAKWCIGNKNSDKSWKEYVIDEESAFIMFFNKNYKNDDIDSDYIKYMLEITPTEKIDYWYDPSKLSDSLSYRIWTPEDTVGWAKLSDLQAYKKDLIKMYAEVRKALEEIN